MGSAGEDEGDDVPPTPPPDAAVVVTPAPAENELGLAAFDELAEYWCVFGLSRSLVEFKDEEDEFRLSLWRRYPTNPVAGIGWAAATNVVDGFAEGKGKEGRGGGMRVVVAAPIVELSLEE